MKTKKEPTKCRYYQRDGNCELEMLTWGYPGACGMNNNCRDWEHK